MPTISLSRGMKLEVSNRLCTLRGSVSAGVLLIEDDLDGSVLRKTQQDLHGDILAGTIRLLCDSSWAASSPKVVEERLEQDLATLPPTIRAELDRRRAYVARAAEAVGSITARSVSDPLIAEVATALGDPCPPSPITLYRWLRDYRTAQNDIRALIPMTSRRGNRKPRLPDEVHDLTEKLIRDRYMRRGGPGVRPAHDGIIMHIRDANHFREAGQLLPEPSLRSIYRKIEAMDAYEVMAARRGKRMADIHFRPVGKSTQPTRPLERVEIDHTKLDIIVVDEERRLPIGRAWLTWAIDVYSRLPVGFHLGFIPPSSESVQLCLKHMIPPKAYIRDRYPTIKGEWPCFGVPETIVVDNGMEFHSRDFEDACGQLDINIQYSPRRSPWMKGAVERSFRTANAGLFHGNPGSTFSNIIARGDYDPVRDAVVSQATLLEMLHGWIIDVYARTAHGGIGDTPLHKWQVGIESFPVRLLSKAQDLNVLTQSVEKRRIFHYGIEFHHLRYNSDGLGMLRRRHADKLTVRFKYDPSDLGRIHVVDPETKRLFPVPAVDTEYADGLSLWQHKVIVRYAREELRGRIDIDGLREARERIRAQVEQEMGRKKPRSRAVMERFQPPVLTPPPQPQPIIDPSFDPCASVACDDHRTPDSADDDEWAVHFDLPAARKVQSHGH